MKFEVYFHRLIEMTRCEWKLREQSTIFGFLWTLLHPAIMFIILYLLFTKWFTGHVKGYPSFLLIGIVQFFFFTNATTYGLSSLRRRCPLLANFKMPWEIVVFSSILSVAMSHVLEWVLMLSFLLILGNSINSAWLFIPVIVAIQICMIAGIALFLTVGNMRFLDIERMWAIATLAGIFVTPVFYPLKVINPGFQKFLWLNPMTHFIGITRACILKGQLPSLFHITGLFLFSVAVLAGGYILLKKQEIKLLDYR